MKAKETRSLGELFKSSNQGKELTIEQELEHSKLDIVPFIASMDRELTAALKNMIRFRAEGDQASVAAAAANVRLAKVQRDAAQRMYNNLNNLQNQYRLNKIIGKYSENLKGIARLTKKIDITDYAQLAKAYNDALAPLNNSLEALELLSPELHAPDYGISNEDIDLLCDRIMNPEPPIPVSAAPAPAAPAPAAPAPAAPAPATPAPVTPAPVTPAPANADAETDDFDIEALLKKLKG